jgi:exodeoxyribonuclease V gamma subunit
MALTGMKPVDPLPIDLPVGRFRLKGSVTGLYRTGEDTPTQRIQHRHADLKGKDLLKAWVSHLAWSVAVHPTPTSTTVIAPKKNKTFGPVEDAASVLEGLLELFWEGLSSPLPFFCKSSLTYAEAIARGKSPAGACEAAAGEWDPQRKEREDHKEHKECDEPAHVFCFPPRPFTPRFEQLALQIYQPLLTAQRAAP